MMRHPAILLTLCAAFQFGVKQRWPWNIPDTWKKEWRSVHATNLAMVLATIGMGLWVGFPEFLMIQLPVLSVAAPIGIWLFYMQHQFEDAYWRHKADWNYVEAALEGSSFYDLPRLLHWFTANIGFHHIHHLDSAIPCYQLRRCMEENEDLQDPVSFTLFESFGCGHWALWDEDAGKMVGFDVV
jgi:omega-6 fatty acid desaturase (delta-12 desaturase)